MLFIVLKCPTCCKEHKIPSIGSERFPKNFTLGNLIDVLEQQSNNTLIQHDELIPLSTDTDCTVPSILCSDHVIVMEYYCMTCKLVICENCVGQLHKGHVIDKIERMKDRAVSEMKRLVAEVETKLVELNEEASSLIEKDAKTIASCKMAVEEYYDKHEEKIEQKISKLKDQLQSIKAHHDQLLEKVDRMSAIQNKNRTVDQDMTDQLGKDMSSSVRSAKALINNNDDATIVHESNKIIEKLKKVSGLKIDSASLKPSPKFTFSKMADPLACEIINPRGVTVNGLKKAKAGANTFTLALTTPLIKKPRLRINIVLPNGRKADADTIKFTPLSENSWSISYYIPVGSFPLSGFFSKGANKVAVSILLCDVEIDGSPFEIPCDRLIGT